MGMIGRHWIALWVTVCVLSCNGGFAAPSDHLGAASGHAPTAGTSAHTPPRSFVIAPRSTGFSAGGGGGRTGGAGSGAGQHGTFVSHLRDGGIRTEHVFSGGGRILEATHQSAHGTMHVLRYGEGNGMVDYAIRPGFFSRTYVQGGHLAYARVYQEHVLNRFGRSFSYQSVVPSMAFSAVYYDWAVHAWPTPVRYPWQWRQEHWYAYFGDYFTPYDAYSSLDLWMTDFILAQNLRDAFVAWQASTASMAQAVHGSPAAGDDAGPASQGVSGAPGHEEPEVSEGPPPPEESPPPITPEVKAELDAQIKVQLHERRSAKRTPDEDDLPNSLKPGHTLFRVVSPLDVDSDKPGSVCALNSNDYIERTGDLDHDGMVPVEVKLSGVSDCGTGLTTRVSANDLEAMDSEQQEQLTAALLAASKSMGPNGLPKAPTTTPMLIAAGHANPAPDALGALHQLR